MQGHNRPVESGRAIQVSFQRTSFLRVRFVLGSAYSSAARPLIFTLRMERMKTHLQIALEELGRYAVPIFAVRMRTQSPYLVGTGTFYRSTSGVFLITAKHVVDELEDGLVVTGGKNGFIRFAPEMAAFEYNEGGGRDHDICIVRIPPEVIENLNTHYRFVQESQVSVVGPYDKLTLYAFVGYPHSKNKPMPKSVSKKVEVRPFYYVVREPIDIGRLHTIDKSEELHVAFNAPFKEFRDISFQNYLQPPDPHRISGCGVWKIKLNKSTGQIDQWALVAVGIEHIKQDNAFVATRIHSPLMAIKKFTEMLKKNVQPIVETSDSC